MKNLPKTWWPWLAAALALIVAALIFEPVWPLNMALMSPDSPPYYVASYKAEIINNLVNHHINGFSHDQLLALLLPPLVYHDFSYVFAAALLAAAAAAYLKGRGLALIPTLMGALSMAFAGYHFTLFNPGHRGYLNMVPYAVFIFALIDRAIERPRWSHFVLMAVCVAAGIANQPDVVMLFLGLAVAYTLLRLVQQLRRSSPDTRRRLYGGWGVGLAVAAIAILIAGFSVIQRTLTVTLQHRASQISQSSGRPPSAAANKDTAAEKESAWVFATNWSLPPEDLAEFVVPNLRGLDTGNRQLPYWGRLGQSLEWPEQGFGFPNFRQHSLYLGVWQVLLALFAVVTIFGRGHFRPSPASLADSDENPATSPTLPDENRAIVIFWSITAIIATLLALGRYAPLYRLFYSLPLMHNLRAPVKFHHLTELAVAILSAFGLAAALQSAADGKQHRHPLLVMLGLTLAAMLIAALGGILNPAASETIRARLAGFGLEQLEPGLSAHYLSACLKTAARFLGGALFFALITFASVSRRRLLATAAAALLLLAATIDLALVARPYVNGVDVGSLYARNPIAESLLAGETSDGMAIAFQLGQATPPSEHPLLWIFQRDGFEHATPPLNATLEWPVLQSWTRLSPDIRKQWQLWGARVLLTTPQSLPNLIRLPEFKLLGTYALRNGRISAVPPEQAQFGALRYDDWTPPAALYSRWRSAEAENLWEIMTDKDLRFDQEVVVQGAPLCDSQAAPTVTPARIITPPSRASGRQCRIEVKSDEAGMLLLRERFGDIPQVNVTVNGQPRPALRANAFFWAVPLAAGEHTVVFTPVLAWWRLALHLLSLLLAIGAFADLQRSRCRAPCGC